MSATDTIVVGQQSEWVTGQCVCDSVCVSVGGGGFISANPLVILGKIILLKCIGIGREKSRCRDRDWD